MPRPEASSIAGTYIVMPCIVVSEVESGLDQMTPVHYVNRHNLYNYSYPMQLAFASVALNYENVHILNLQKQCIMRLVYIRILISSTNIACDGMVHVQCAVSSYEHLEQNHSSSGAFLMPAH